MSGQLSITFKLSDEDAEYFRAIYRKTKQTGRALDADRVIREALEKVEDLRGRATVPSFVLELAQTVESLAQVVTDPNYAAPKRVITQVTSALAYFSDDNGLIADEVPALGFLDDALIVRLIEEDLGNELRGFRKFCNCRKRAETRAAWKGWNAKDLNSQLGKDRKRIRAEIDRRNKGI